MKGGTARRATRHFWAVLVAAAATSVACNIGSAVLVAGPHRWVAAALAVIPPLALIGATESAAALWRSGAAKSWLMAVTVAMLAVLGVSAAVLSFHAIAALAELAGTPRVLSWLVPIVVDVSTAQSVTAILVVSGRGGAEKPKPRRRPTPGARRSRAKPPVGVVATSSATNGHHPQMELAI